MTVSTVPMAPLALAKIFLVKGERTSYGTISTKVHNFSDLTQLTFSFGVTGPMVQKTTQLMPQSSTVILDSRKNSRATMTRSTLEMEEV